MKERSSNYVQSSKEKLKLKMKTLKEENLYKKMELNTQRN